MNSQQIQQAANLARSAGLDEDEVKAIIEALLYKDIDITERLTLSLREQEQEDRLSTETFMRSWRKSEARRLSDARKAFLEAAEEDNELTSTVQDEFKPR